MNVLGFDVVESMQLIRLISSNLAEIILIATRCLHSRRVVSVSKTPPTAFDFKDRSWIRQNSAQRAEFWQIQLQSKHVRAF